VEVLEKEKVTCYHCGDDCEPGDEIHFEDHTFCCNGCKSVYQILQEADLCDFYDLEEKTGRVRSADERKYLALDEPEVASQFIEFEGQGVARVTFFVPSIHCSSCIWLLEHLGRIHPGVIKSLVHFPRKEVTVTFATDQLTLKEVAILLDSLGYGPLVESRKNKKSVGNDLVIRLAVAGFCFGNSMLLSLPEYLELNDQIPENYLTIFGYINFLFSLPVFLYSSQIYFKSAWKGIKHRFINIDVPISIGIVALFGRSTYEIFFLHELGFVDSLAGLVFFLLIGRWFQHKTYQALNFDRDISSYFPIAVAKWVEGKEFITKIQDLKENDEIVIRNQELIPADGELVQGVANIDYSFVTGESVPTSHEPGEKLFAGGRQLGTPIRIRLSRKVLNSHLTKLWNQSGEGARSNLNDLSDRISRYFTAVVLILALMGGVIWFYIDPGQIVPVVTAILIVACPCALALAVPFTYGHTQRIFGQQGLYLKNASLIETMARVKHFVFDKTGTLTTPIPEEVIYRGKELTEQDKQWIYSLAALSIHPLSKILKSHLNGSKRVDLDDFEEITGKGSLARIGSNTIRLGSAKWLGTQSGDQINVTSVFVEINGVLKGQFVFKNQYREGVFDMLTKLKDGRYLELLSGDNDSERQRLEPFFDQQFFRQSPEDKYHHLEELRKTKNSISMVGDGLNDAGALKNSDFGISISDDIYQFSPASDAILDARRLYLLDKFLVFSKKATGIVWAAFVISFLYNLVGLSFAFMGKLTPLVSSILMPISSITVVTFITVLTRYAAKGLFRKPLQ
jgi:Cu+-exporting ATPase